MREFNHFGIPTDKKQKNESYLESGKVYITDIEKSPNRIEFLRFEPDNPMPDLLKTTAHISYKVDEVEKEMAGKEILVEPFHPADGITVAFIVEEGIPIELLSNFN